MTSEIRTIEWVDDHLVILDQTQLPTVEKFLTITTVEALVDAIQRLAVRGAPALGVVGAYGVVIALDQGKRENWSEETIQESIDLVRNARPTAVNLAWGVHRVEDLISQGRSAVLEAAKKLASEDYLANRAMAKLGADWLLEKLGDKPLTILTHCNTGSLATNRMGELP
ncbi:MAG: hypothetical protein WDO06_00670 [Actinomycetota bacterium]